MTTPSADTIALFTMPFGKHKDKPLAEIPKGYLNWLLDNTDLRPATREIIETFVGRAPAPDPGHAGRAPGEPPPARRRRAPTTPDAPIARCTHCGLGGTTDRPLVHADCAADVVPF